MRRILLGLCVLFFPECARAGDSVAGEDAAGSSESTDYPGRKKRNMEVDQERKHGHKMSLTS